MAADNFDLPDDTELVGPDGKLSMPWLQLLSRWQRIVTSLVQSGSTLNRPTKTLWLGRTYYDTTLSKPIWVKQVRPSIVWVDASGTPV
jgi:hypothetical protein